MTQLEIKERIHNHIDTASEAQLEAILAILEQDKATGYQYDEDTLNMLEERRANYLSGKSKSYTWEETLAFVRSNGNV